MKIGIGIKLISSFILVAILVAAVGLIGSMGLKKMEASADVILDEKVPVSEASLESVIAQISGRILLDEYMLSRDSAELDKVESEFQQKVADFDQYAGVILEKSSSELGALVKEADDFHSKFQESAAKAMESHRLFLAAEEKAGAIMADFGKHVVDLKSLLSRYESELTRGKSIDERVNAVMESKTLMVTQQVIAAEYMGLDSLEGSAGLREEFHQMTTELGDLGRLLPEDVIKEHADFVELAIGKGKLFDQKDESLRMFEEMSMQMSLVDQYSEKGDLLLGKVGKAADGEMTAAVQSADSTRVSSIRMIVMLTAIAFLAAVLIGVFIGRHISKPMQKAVYMIEELGRGHLDNRLNMDRKDEIGRMAKALDAFAENLQDEVLAAFQKLADGNLTFEAEGLIKEPLARANKSLNEVMAQIQIAGEQIASGSSQVSSASQSLSQGATEQASSLEEIASSMNEMASQTKINAENAGQASRLSGETKGAAEKGNKHMRGMVAAMGEINEAGRNISKIIKVIDEIAFQTNLLALNAAVEAARAGKHGKGFAVVAEEVRNLAARSAKAAKETAELIEGSVAKTKTGTEIATQTEEALQEIVSLITKVTDLVSEIAAASNEQAEGISQVNEGLGQIDQVTQQNTANAEESAAAAEELSSQAAQLRKMLFRFTLRGQVAGVHSEPPAQQAEQVVLEYKSSANGYGSEDHLQMAANDDLSWGDPETSQKEGPAAEIIRLDDQEFGKYS